MRWRSQSRPRWIDDCRSVAQRRSGNGPAPSAWSVPKRSQGAVDVICMPRVRSSDPAVPARVPGSVRHRPSRPRRLPDRSVERSGWCRRGVHLTASRTHCRGTPMVRPAGGSDVALGKSRGGPDVRERSTSGSRQRPEPAAAHRAAASGADRYLRWAGATCTARAQPPPRATAPVRRARGAAAGGPWPRRRRAGRGVAPQPGPLTR